MNNYSAIPQEQAIKAAEKAILRSVNQVEKLKKNHQELIAALCVDEYDELETVANMIICGEFTFGLSAIKDACDLAEFMDERTGSDAFGEFAKAVDEFIKKASPIIYDVAEMESKKEDANG